MTSDDIVQGHGEFQIIKNVKVYQRLPIWSTVVYQYGLLWISLVWGHQAERKPMGFHWDSTGADAGLRQGHIHGRSFLDQFLDSHIGLP